MCPLALKHDQAICHASSLSGRTFSGRAGAVEDNRGAPLRISKIMISKVWLALGKLVFLVLLTIVLGYGVAAWRVAQFGNERSDESADAAVVLGAAAWGDQPSPVYRERLNEALILYQTGRVRRIIFTGGTPKPGYLTEAEVGRKFALAHGIPAKAILLDTESRSTWQNLTNAKKLVTAAKLDTVLVVSDPLHMRRAMRMATDIGLHAKPAPTTSSRYQSWRYWSNFLWRETSLYLAYIVFKKLT